MKRTAKRGLGSIFSSLAALVALLALVVAIPARAQDHTILFSPTDPGITRSITNWGLDTCWASFDNMQRGLIFMGTNNVNMVRVGFFVDAPLTNNDVTPTDKSSLQTCINLAGMATTATRWDMNLNSSVNTWYQSGINRVYPDRWAAAIEACQRYYNRSIGLVEGFNEPDLTSNNEGSSQDLYDIFGYLQSSTNFPSALMAGGSTLNNDVALAWFNPVAARASIGTTHCLAGSASTYVSFLQAVTASNAAPFNPELHNVMEAIMGVNYGLKGGIWWGPAELARGNFVKACQGQRLGYADDLAKWTAAAVYRGTNGAVQAFAGGSERMATTTSYRFFSKDRDVFYDGYGPQRNYDVTVPGGTGYQVNQPSAEQVVNITWGADVPPAIGGRYILVNHKSGLVVEVPGSGTSNGTVLHQNTLTNGLNQKWDVYPLTNNFGGDISYFSITAAHDGVTMDLNNFSYANGGIIQQWNGGTNVVEQWYFQYVTNGWFKLRSRWSNKVMDVSGASTSTGAQIVQWDDTGALDQQWRLVPATVTNYDFVAPAVPTGLAAVASAVSVQLNWNTNSESDLASYTMLRSTTNGGPYYIVARGLTNNAFTDKSANLPQAYYYVVQAVDKSLNISGNSAQASATPTCAPALVAYYTFNNNATDSSGNANDAIVTYGSPTYGSSVKLNGTSQYLMLPANMLASVTNFTIAAWVYWNGGSAWQRIFDFGNDTTNYMFLTPSSGSALRFAVTTNGLSSEQSLQTTTPLASHRWVHVAITRNGTVTRLYTNGVVAVAATNVITIAPASFNSALNYLGKSQYAADPLFNGLLDDLYIYNYALSDSEIAALSVPQAPDIVSWNYDNNGTVPTNGIAGVEPAANWNNSWPNNPTVNLADNTGTPTTVDIAYNSFGGWSIQGSHPGLDADGSYNRELLNGYLNSGNSNTPTNSSVSITQIPFAYYDLYVYFSSDTAGRIGTVTDGTTTYGFSTLGASSLNNASGNAVLTRTTAAGTGYPAANYAVFTGLTGSSKTINCNIPLYGGIAGFQLVQRVLAPAAPANLTATAGDTQTTLSWSPSAGATAYNVKSSTTNGGPYVLIGAHVIGLSFTNTGLINGTTYYYVVSALNIGGESTNSTQVSASPTSTAPVNLSFAQASGAFELTWPADHTGWRLQSQTNTLGTGLGTNWFDVSGSTTTNSLSLPIDLLNDTVFYRLIYP